MSARISYFNGEFKEHQDCKVHIEDRAFQFGDGVYEVFLFKNNKLIDYQAHYQRLLYSLRELQIKFSISADKLSEICFTIFKKNNLSEGFIYLQISRGEAPRIQDYPVNCSKPNFIVSSWPITAETNSMQGINCITHQDIRWKRRDIKSTALLANSMVLQKAKEQNATEAILLDEDDFITESCFANAFIVNKNQEIITRETSHNILAGITRARVINLAQKDKMKIFERKFSKNELLAATEIFITSSTKLIRPVIKLDGDLVADDKIGKITLRLAKLYDQYIND
jgi:D-alanine transaminase